jgi:hypothetical protein
MTPVRLAGSTRTWRRCGGGHGSTTADARRGLVVVCSEGGGDVWRQGVECGPMCPGYPAGTTATVGDPPPPPEAP